MTVNSTSIISDLIEEAVDYDGMVTLTSIKNNQIIVSEIEIQRCSPVLNKRVSDIRIPEDCIWVSVIKNNELLRPDPDLLLLIGDSVIFISSMENKKRLRNVFIGKK